MKEEFARHAKPAPQAFQNLDANRESSDAARRALQSNVPELDVLVRTLNSRVSSLEGSVHALQGKVESLGRSTWRSVVKRRILRPLIVVLNRLIPADSRFRTAAGGFFAQRFPGLHARLSSLSRKQSVFSQLDSSRMKIVGARNEPSDLHPVLSKPDLLRLERPKSAFLTSEALQWTQFSEYLDPVLDLNQMRQSAASVCFVVWLFEVDRSALQRTLQSVLRQTDPTWEVLLCGSPERTDLVTEWLEIDWRVRCMLTDTSGTQAHHLHAAALQATTSFVGLLSLGDVIDDDLVKMIGHQVRLDPNLDLIYTDEASRLGNDEVGKRFHKPDWSPEHQYSVNMVGRFAAIRKSLLLRLAAPDETHEAAAEYHLLLEASSHARSIAHIDELLYINAAAPDAAIGGFFPPAALSEARQALETHVRKESACAYVTADSASGALRVTWPTPVAPITLLILTGMYEREIPGRGKIVLALNFVQSIIAKSSCTHYKILVVDDGFVPEELRQLLDLHGHSSVSYPKKPTFSFADKANFATAQVEAGIVLLLNDDLEVISPDWIEVLASQAARPEVGVAGGKLQFPDGTIQHAGIALGFHGTAGHMFHKAPSDGSEYAGFATIERNYSAVTGAVMAYRKEVFDAVGGFDTQFKTDYNDLDFCLKCIGAGYRVVYSPRANLYHFHNASLKRSHDNDVERKAFVEKWSAIVTRDPYFSKHFQTESHDRPPLGA